MKVQSIFRNFIYPTIVVVSVSLLTAMPASADFLSQVQVVTNGQDGVQGLQDIQNLAIPEDGLHVYSVSYESSSVSVFERNSGSGELTFVESLTETAAGIDVLHNLNSLAISPDGEYLYTVGSVGLAVFARNLASGQLTYVRPYQEGQDGISGMGGPQDIVISNDGQNAYVVSFFDDALVEFDRDPSTGLLTFMRKHEHILDVDGLLGGSAVAISPDDKSVYAAGFHDGSLLVFQRNLNSGTLQLVQEFRFGIDGGPGIDGIWDVKVSPDGLHVITGARTGDAVGVFARDPATGLLQALEPIGQGAPGVQRMTDIRSVAISPSGEYVYAAAWLSNAVVVLKRNPISGTLEFMEAQYSSEFLGVGTAGGLLGATSVAISPDAKFVYVAGESGNTIGVFLASLDFYNPTFQINAGLNDAWYNPETSGQGFFVNVFPDIKKIFLAWFTYDLDRPSPDITAQLGDPGHRWLTAFGDYDNDTAELEVEITSGGIFDSATPEPSSRLQGSISLRFLDCNSAVVDYSLPASGQFGEIDIQRISNENLGRCQSRDGIVEAVSKSTSMALEEPQATHQFVINPGLNDAWFNPITSGQGFFVNVFPTSKTVFLAWFTYELERPPIDIPHQLGEPGHRWLTAFGPFENGRAELEIEMTTGGVFNSGVPPVSQHADGEITLEFESCDSALVTYSIPSVARQGEVPIERLALDNVPDCEAASQTQ